MTIEKSSWHASSARQIGDRYALIGGVAKRFALLGQIWTEIFSCDIAMARFVFGSINRKKTPCWHQAFEIY